MFPSHDRGVTTTGIEGAIDALPYLDKSTNLESTWNATGGSVSKKIDLSVSTRLTVRNNYMSEAVVDVYLVVPRIDTGVNPLTAYTDGLTDQGTGLGQTTINMYPTDSDIFNQLWRIKKHTRRRLKGGDQFDLFYNTGLFEYNPAAADTQNDQYQPRDNAHSYLIRIEGVLSHDTTNDEQAISQAGVDLKMKRVFTVKYAGGINQKRYEVSNTLDSITNGCVQSQTPGTDNKCYQVGL